MEINTEEIAVTFGTDLSLDRAGSQRRVSQEMVFGFALKYTLVNLFDMTRWNHRDQVYLPLTITKKKKINETKDFQYTGHEGHDPQDKGGNTQGEKDCTSLLP